MAKGSITDVLTKLPLASTVLLSPHSSILLDLLIRLGYDNSGKGIHVPLDTLHNGSERFSYQPCMTFRGRPCNHTTIAKYREELIHKGFIDYSISRVPNVLKQVSTYTINAPAIHTALSSAHKKALSAGLLSNLIDPSRVISDNDKAICRRRVYSTYIRFLSNWLGYKYSVLEYYIYGLVTALAMSSGSNRLVNLLDKVCSMVPSATKRYLRAVLSTLERSMLLGRDYETDYAGGYVSVVNIPNDIQIATPNRVVSLA